METKKPRAETGPPAPPPFTFTDENGRDCTIRVERVRECGELGDFSTRTLDLATESDLTRALAERGRVMVSKEEWEQLTARVVEFEKREEEWVEVHSKRIAENARLRSQLSAQSAVVEAAKALIKSEWFTGYHEHRHDHRKWDAVKKALASAGSSRKRAGGESEPAECRSCDGEGWVIPRSQFDDGVRCRDCRGTGIAPATEEPAPKQGEAPVWERHHYSILRDREQLAICETRDQAEAVVETVKADLRNAPAGVPVERVEAVIKTAERISGCKYPGLCDDCKVDLKGLASMLRLTAKPDAGGGG